MADIRMNEEVAVLMAAGLGARMRPLTDTTAKPLVKVNGMPMIETVIRALEKRGIGHIYVVVGYKKEQFKYLIQKYDNLSLVENKEYLEKNNISSVYAVKDRMKGYNCFICEADLYVTDENLLRLNLKQSCYFGRYVKGHSDDWIFEQNRDGKIIRIGIGGDDVYNRSGIAYFQKEDVDILTKCIEKAYKLPGHENLFWDDIVNQSIDQFDLIVNPVAKKSIIEIDTVEELCAVEREYKDIGLHRLH